MQRPLIAGGTSSATEESPARTCIRPLSRHYASRPPRPRFPRGGNWFYNLKQACRNRSRRNTASRRAMHARFHMRAPVPLQITFPDWRSMPALELVPHDSIEPTPYYIKRGAPRRCLSTSSCLALLSGPRIEIPDPPCRLAVLLFHGTMTTGAGGGVLARW